jgi:hypothetical protein
MAPCLQSEASRRPDPNHFPGSRTRYSSWQCHGDLGPAEAVVDESC